MDEQVDEQIDETWKVTDDGRWHVRGPLSPLTDVERAQVLKAIARTESQWDGGHVELRRLLEAHDYWESMYDRLKESTSV